MRPDPGESQNQAEIPQAGATQTEDSIQGNQLSSDIYDLKHRPPTRL